MKITPPTVDPKVQVKQMNAFKAHSQAWAKNRPQGDRNVRTAAKLYAPKG